MSLKLITTEKFRELDCKFYRNSNDETLLTREQIGTALEYSNPRQAISKIHNKYKNRFDGHSGVTVLDTPSGRQEIYYYTTTGVMEICRWSRQPRANDFIDFTWNVMNKLLHGENISQNNSMIENILQMRQDTNKQLIQMLTKITSTLPQPYKPPFTRWISKTYEKIDKLASNSGVTRKQMLRNLYSGLQDTYDLDLNEHQYEYCMSHNISNNSLYTMNIIGADPQLKQWFDLIVDTQLEQIVS